MIVSSNWALSYNPTVSSLLSFADVSLTSRCCKETTCLLWTITCKKRSANLTSKASSKSLFKWLISSSAVGGSTSSHKSERRILEYRRFHSRTYKRRSSPLQSFTRSVRTSSLSLSSPLKSLGTFTPSSSTNMLNICRPSRMNWTLGMWSLSFTYKSFDNRWSTYWRILKYTSRTRRRSFSCVLRRLHCSGSSPVC